MSGAPRHAVGFRPHPGDQPVRAWNWDYHKNKTPGPRVETEVVRPAHTGAKLSWSVFCREGGWGRKTPRCSMHKLLWYVLDKFLIFKDLGPRLPFEIGGVWTGDLSLCD